MERKRKKNGLNQDLSDERITMILNTWNHRLHRFFFSVSSVSSVAKLISKHSHFENCRKIYFSVDFLSLLYYIITFKANLGSIFRQISGP